ncbi:MAG: amidohydrolase family protein [Leptospiraceae bacterium]|nr:amidohydrolase family protein [Leptospiraceae bacterium]
MNRLKTAFKILFIISWVCLFLWSFRSVRVRLYETVIWALGYGLAPGTSTPKEFIELSSFHPVSMLKPVQENFVKEPVFDTIEIHGHIFRDPPKDFLGAMDKLRSKYFINLSLQTVTASDYLTLRKKFNSERIFHFVGFNWKHSKDENFGSLMAKDLEEIAKLGARGIKLWKNFGLMVRDKNDKLIQLDDQRLDPVWDVVVKYNLLVCMHTADPPAFFKPLDEKNERFEEFAKHTSWSFYRDGLPSFDDLIEQRNRLFQKRRDITFVAQHFGESAHDLKRAGEILEKNPNVYFDIAQRIDELGRQPRAARKFFIKWQDRLLFGTDGLPDYEKIKIYWRFLETDDEYFDYYPPSKPRKGFWKISGIHLPKEALRKIYYENAAKLLGIKM